MKRGDSFEKISAGAVSSAMPKCTAILINAGGSGQVLEMLNQMHTAPSCKVYVADTSLEHLSGLLERCREAGIPAIVNCGPSLPAHPLLLPSQKPYTAAVVSADSYGELADNSPDIISRIINDSYAMHAACIGFQGYYFSPDKTAGVRSRYFEQMRLGELRSNIALVEPVVRETEYTFIDFASVRYSDYPLEGHSNPNGMYAEEICQLARYIGFGTDVKGIFLYSTPADGNNAPVCNRLVAETIWHLCQGISSNIIENPAENEEDEHFIRKIITIEGNGEEIVFINSLNTDRWWMEISVPEYKKPLLVPCAATDYKSACNGEIPLRWLFFYQKYSIM